VVFDFSITITHDLPIIINYEYHGNLIRNMKTSGELAQLVAKAESQILTSQ